MLEPLFGAANREKVLFYLQARGESYPREIAEYYKTGLSPIQKQMERLEEGGILYSRMVGRTRLYAFNPRYPMLDELTALLDKALTFYPERERDRLFMDRRRPRRKGKPL